LSKAGAQVPVTPFVDVVGNADKLPPAQIAATCVNVGTVGALTVIVMLAPVAHKPAVGVKLYVVVAALLSAGAQVPVTPLFDVVGNADKLPPAQIAATCVNVGTVGALTVIVILAAVAHKPAVGVKLYVVVAALLSAGAQVPVTPLSDVVGNADKLLPAQIAATCVNVGTVGVFTVMVIVAVVAHNPAVGVKV